MSIAPIRDRLIDRVNAVALRHLDESSIAMFEDYVDNLVHIHSDESLLRWDDDSLYYLHLGLFNSVKQKLPTDTLVKVFNPDPGLDGWKSRYTVIYFCHLDIPFLVDSLRIALNRHNLSINLFEGNPVNAFRDTEGKLTAVLAEPSADSLREEHGFILVDKLTDLDEHEKIRQGLLNSIGDVATVVADFKAMLARMDELIGEHSQRKRESTQENLNFLEWLRDGNFTFLGISDFRFSNESEDPTLVEKSNSRLGLMSLRDKLQPAKLSSLNQGFADFYRRDEDLAFAKSTFRSTVHRDTYPDYVVVKRYQDDKVIGETRILGLYTARLYHLSIAQIPMVRKKAQWLIDQSRFNPNSHNGKAYISILEGYPRDELILGRLPDLLEATLSIWKIYERRTVKLFIRYGSFQKFVSCLVYLPRESLRTETRERIEKLLSDALGAVSSEYTTQFLAESVLARIHFVFRVANNTYLNADHKKLEDSVVEIVHNWSERFAENALSYWGEEKGALLARQYQKAFPSAYQDHMSPLTAVKDIDLFKNLVDDSEVAMSFDSSAASSSDLVSLKLFRRDAGIELSDMIPILENLGFRVLVDHPYKISPLPGNPIWMQNFSLRYECGDRRLSDMSGIKENFGRAFHAIWKGEMENGTLNRLVVAAALDWRQVNLLRAYSSYLKQLGSSLSAKFISNTMLRYVDITKALVELFSFQFDPEAQEDWSIKGYETRVEAIEIQLETVESINEDQVFRNYLQLIRATLRTNYFCLDKSGQHRPCLSLKFATKQIDVAPKPRPEYEIFVYSTRLEGVHLRGGKVARGGIRWSDRFEDFRTEVLGLVKAQQVKNAVIVPSGAKGGFIARRSIQMKDRESYLKEGLDCYRLFISSLLDITDNRVNGKIVHPEMVRICDEDDPYLVVAADKGTATYSDEANAISEEYGHWLGDAFASGGSQGYDHKKMGITAKGAWVAVQRHFRELGLDIQNELFSVVAIGDMAGDVFGNGMLLSKQTQLLAAFNHLHIFVDPNPDAAKSWKERKRLFDLPRSSWLDYSQKLISQGGGVFLRSAKSIAISPEMAKRFDIKASKLEPDALIRALLRAKIDLIWNGGIGTYVKSSDETHAEVGDRGSESLRLDGKELRARVFGEGGNLGMTQLGRIEFCQNGGICNTDFIDNAAGVDCSDHEVNIKILLNKKVAAKQMSYEDRNGLLMQMTESVSDLVLRNNYRQTLAISLAQSGRQERHFDYLRFLCYLETHAGLDRKLEFLPDDETIRELYRKGLCWTRPELAVMLSYAKVDLKTRLLVPEIADDPALRSYLQRPFPQPLIEKYSKEIDEHQLDREIIATQLANDLVNRMGMTFCFRLSEAVGASLPEIARAYYLVVKVFDLDQWWTEIEALDYQIESALQHQMFNELMRLSLRSTRWFLRNCRGQSLSELIILLEKPMQQLVPQVYELQSDLRKKEWSQETNKLTSAGVSEPLANKMASVESCFLLPGILLSTKGKKSIARRAKLQFCLADHLGLDWLMDYLMALNSESHWQDLAKEAFIFELENQLRVLAEKIGSAGTGSLTARIEKWSTQQASLIQRFQIVMGELRKSETRDFSMITVAISDLKDLVYSS